MSHILLRIISNTAAIYAAAWLVPGFDIVGSWQEYLLAGFALAILNTLVKPVVKFVSFPLIFLTLGLFSFVINAAMLWALVYLFDFIVIQGWIALGLATIVVSGVNLFFDHK